MKVLFWCFVLIMSALASVDSQRNLKIRQKLERLLKDPAYNDVANEISRPRQGMLLKDFSERNRFDTTSEERFYRKLSKRLESILSAEERSEEEKAKVAITKRLQRISAAEEHSEEEKPKVTITATATTTTTIVPSTINSEATDDEEITTSEQRLPRSSSSLSSIISRLIGMWRRN